MARKGGLGKGLDSLISSDYRKTESIPRKKDLSTGLSTKSVEKVDKSVDEMDKSIIKEARMIKVIDIEPNREQPRKNFAEDTLEELTESVRRYGVIQPLLVKAVDGHYVIIAGERRWRAAKQAGLKEIPAIVKEYSTQEVMEIALIENIQREDLNAIEEAKAYQKLLQEFGYRQEDLAEKLSKSRTVITNRIRLLKLAESVQGLLMEGAITEGHARALLGIEDPEEQFRLAMRIVDEQLTVREIEKLVKKALEPEKPEGEDWKSVDQFVYDKWEEELKVSMGTKVAIKRKKKDKGQILIDYYSVEELERLMEILQRQG